MNMNQNNHDKQTNMEPEEVLVDKAKNVKGTAFRLIKQLLKQKWRLLVILVSIIAGSLFTLLSPMVIGKTINIIFDGIKKAALYGETFSVNFQTIGIFMVSLLVLYVLSAAFSYLQEYTMAHVAQKLTLTMRQDISAKLNRLPLSFYDSHKKGDILSRATSDLEKVADTLQDGFTQLFTAVVGVVGGLIIMIGISPMLTLIALVTIVFGLIISGFISTKTQKNHAKSQKALGNLNAGIEEAYTGNSIINAFNLQEETTEKVERLSEDLYRSSKKAQFLTYVVNPIIRLVNQLGYVVVAVRGAIMAINGVISIGDIQAFIQYVNQISEPITQLSYIGNSMQGAIAAAERVFEIMDEADETADCRNPQTLSDLNGSVIFDHVRFGYSEDSILMNNININVKAGSKIAVVGPTGAGKTTLVNLLMRFYELQSGKIMIDGVNIAKMRRNDLRSIMGMVLQDTWLFGGTIEANIAYSCATATKQEVRQAAVAARADGFIKTLPDGYDTILADDASNISHGQRQLLTIARAILADPAILILDEATSSVDTRTEIEIQKAMDTLMKGRTSFIIAHRLSTIQDADLILVMKEGTIIEQGSHDELIREDSFYAEMYNSQFSDRSA